MLESETPQPAPTSRAATITPVTLLGTLAASAIIAGSLGPWGSLGAFSVSGTSGDGIFTLIAGIVGLVLIILGRWNGVVLATALVAAIIGCLDGIKISRVDGGELINVGVGWGLVVVAVGGICLTTWAVIQIAQNRSTALTLAAVAIAVLGIGSTVGLGIGGVFDDEPAAAADTEAAAPDFPEPEPDPVPVVDDGLSTGSCEDQRIDFSGGMEGPCIDSDDGAALWVANRGHAAKLPTLNATLIGARTLDVIPPTDEFSDAVYPEGRFVAVTIRITNTGNDAFEMGPSSFGLLLDNSSYEPSDDYEVDSAIENPLASYEKLGPGLSRTGTVVFDVAKSAANDLGQGGNVQVLPPEWVDEYDDEERYAIRIAVLRTYR